MAYSEDREGLLGGKYRDHFDDQGNKTGESRKRERLFGGDYFENTDTTGRKVSESSRRKDILGDEYIETRDPSGRLLSTSRERETLFGEKIIETRNAEGQKIAESRHRETLFGSDRIETTYVESRASSESGDGTDGLIKFVIGVVVAGVALYFFLINLPGWLGSVTLSVTIAYFYAFYRWKEIKKQPDAGALIEQRTRKRRAPRYEVAASFAEKQICWWPDRLLLSAAGLLIGVAYACLVARSSQDQITRIMVWIGPAVGAFAADFVGTAVLRRRLNELVLREDRLPATHYAWPTLTALVLSMPLLLVVVIGMVSHATSPRPVQAVRPQLAPTPVKLRADVPIQSQNPPPQTVARTQFPVVRSQPPASVPNTPAPRPTVQEVSEASLATQPRATTPPVSELRPMQPSEPIPDAGNRTIPTAEVRTFKGEVYPQTRTSYLTLSDVGSWSAAQAQFAINEMFARHGGEFGNQEIRKWFSQFDWYRPRPGIGFDTLEMEMTPLERENVKFLGAVRDARRNAPAKTRQTPMQQRPRSNRAQSPPHNPGVEKFFEAVLRGIAEGLQKR
jgi:FtsH-binding integral membrane protein